MKAIVILFDTLCRRFLPAYGYERITTPNMVRPAEKSVVLTTIGWVQRPVCPPDGIC